VNNINELLALQAEIAVGFTGFAALVSAVGTSPSEADVRLDRLRLRNLVEIGVSVVLMAMLPLVLQQSESGTRWAWSVSSVLLISLLVAIILFHGGRNRAARISEFAGYNLLGALTIWALGLASVAVLILGLVAPGVIRVEVAYVTALWLMTAVLGIYFIRVASSLLTLKLDGRS
jgi:hypothetical protein